jgi:hypothetical protein
MHTVKLSNKYLSPEDEMQAYEEIALPEATGGGLFVHNPSKRFK